MHALEVLDPVRDRHPRQPRHEIERAAHRGIADGVDRRGDARGRPPSASPPRFRLGGDRHAPVAAALVRLEHPGGAAAEAPVEKHLHAADGEPSRALRRSAPPADERRQRRDRRMKQHPEPEVIRRLEPLERGQAGRVSTSWMPVTPSRCASACASRSAASSRSRPAARADAASSAPRRARAGDPSALRRRRGRSFRRRDRACPG